MTHDRTYPKAVANAERRVLLAGIAYQKTLARLNQTVRLLNQLQGCDSCGEDMGRQAWDGGAGRRLCKACAAKECG